MLLLFFSLSFAVKTAGDSFMDEDDDARIPVYDEFNDSLAFPSHLEANSSQEIADQILNDLFAKPNFGRGWRVVNHCEAL